MKKIFVVLNLISWLAGAQSSLQFYSPTSSGGAGWQLTGNSLGTNSLYIGTNDNRSMLFKTNNIQRLKLDSIGRFLVGPSSLPTQTIGTIRLAASATAWIDIGDNGGASWSLWANRNNSKTTTNYNLFVDNTDMILNDSSSVQVRLANTVAYTATNPRLTGTQSDFFTVGGISFQKTTLQESRQFKVAARTQGFLLGGTLATQRQLLIEALTFSAAVSATLTNPYAGFFTKGIASTNVTITNNWGLGTDGSAHITQSVVIGTTARTPSATIDDAGSLRVATTSTLVGGVSFNSTGADPTVGNATLIAGAVIVNTTKAVNGCFILITSKTNGGTVGNLSYTINPGVSFTIVSTNPLDTSTYTWLIINP